MPTNSPAIWWEPLDKKTVGYTTEAPTPDNQKQALPRLHVPQEAGQGDQAQSCAPSTLRTLCVQSNFSENLQQFQEFTKAQGRARTKRVLLQKLFLIDNVSISL